MNEIESLCRVDVGGQIGSSSRGCLHSPDSRQKSRLYHEFGTFRPGSGVVRIILDVLRASLVFLNSVHLSHSSST